MTLVWAKKTLVWCWSLKTYLVCPRTRSWVGPPSPGPRSRVFSTIHNLRSTWILDSFNGKMTSRVKPKPSRSSMLKVAQIALVKTWPTLMGKWSVLHRRHTKWLSWATVLALNLLNPARPSNCKSRSAVTHYLVRQILQISKHFWKIWSYLHILWVTKLTRREMQMVFKCLQQMLGFLTSSL